MTTTYAGIDGDTLHHVLKNALLFVSKDKTLPILNGVKLSATTEGLDVLATDRYVLSVGHVAPLPDTEAGPLSVVIGAEDVKRILTVIKPASRIAASPVTIVHDEDGDRVTVSQEFTGASVTCATVAGEYPRIRSILNEPPTRVDDRDARIGFDPAKLAALGKLKDYRRNGRGMTPLALAQPERHNSAMPFTFTDCITGAVMPYRLTAAAGQFLPEWLRVSELQPEAESVAA